jgi:hypothetical protein
MPRRDSSRVDPIKLGGMPVGQLNADPPEQQGIERPPTVDWAHLFRVGQFTPEEAQYLILRKIGEFSRSTIAARLGWDENTLHAVESRASRRLRKVKAVLEGMMDDFSGGSSRRLSFTHQLDSGAKFWNLRTLDKSFDETISIEREYIREKISVGPREKG